MKKRKNLVIVGVSVLVIIVGIFFFTKNSAQSDAIENLKNFQSSRACTKDLAELKHTSGATYQGPSNCQPNGPLPDGWQVVR